MVEQLFQALNDFFLLYCKAFLLLFLAFVNKIVEFQGAVRINSYELSLVGLENVSDAATWGEAGVYAEVRGQAELATVTQLHKPNAEFSGTQR